MPLHFQSILSQTSLFGVDSAMNDLYDFRDDVTEAEQALKTARLEHAALGYENALDGSQVAQMLVGSGLTVY